MKPDRKIEIKKAEKPPLPVANAVSTEVEALRAAVASLTGRVDDLELRLRSRGVL
jgi:hypothetical protein